jgi:uncharacterized SAM-binding protein YcdF (DUF218 family)
VDIIMIPGTAQTVLAERASELYLQWYAEFIIMSWSVNKRLPHWVTEARHNADVMIERWVAPLHVLLENEATNTYENAVLTREMLDDLGIKYEKAMLVCKNHHSRRALMTYQTVFWAQTEFIVDTVIDESWITPENRYENQARIDKVLGHVQKIWEYFPDRISMLTKLAE